MYYLYSVTENNHSEFGTVDALLQHMEERTVYLYSAKLIDQHKLYLFTNCTKHISKYNRFNFYDYRRTYVAKAQNMATITYSEAKKVFGVSTQSIDWLTREITEYTFLPSYILNPGIDTTGMNCQPLDISKYPELLI